MREQLEQGLSALRSRFASAFARSRAHRFWIQCVVLTLLALVAAFSFGFASLRRRAAIEAQIVELKKVEVAVDSWRAGVQQPLPTESAAWTASDQQLLALSADSSRPVTLAGLVARRASEVGVSNLSVRELHSDSIPALDPVSLGGWSVEPSGRGLIVEFDTEVAGVMGFLAALPAQAAVSDLQLTPVGEMLHARVVIATRMIRRNG